MRLERETDKYRNLRQPKPDDPFDQIEFHLGYFCFYVGEV